MTFFDSGRNPDCDRTNALIGGLVFLVTFVVYALTVQRSFSFWDCGEFISCAVTLGIPHPPGTPLLILISRIFSMIPFVEDVAFRINYVSVISSSGTTLFSYLIAVRLIRTLFSNPAESFARFCAYAGGIAAGFWVAFSATNWANSVEAEAYGLALGLCAAIVWLTLRYHERRNEPCAWKTMALAIYLAVLGIGVHMTVFLVLPVCSIFFVLNERAKPRDYLLICAYAVIELLMVVIFGNGRGGPDIFKFISIALGLTLFFMLRHKIRWGILVAIAATSSLIISFSLYFKALPAGLIVIALLAWLGQRYKLNVQWKTALAIMVIGFVGFSVHFFMPIRSQLNPRLDMNNTSRGWPTDWRIFKDFLDRKQYGQTSMIDRMFERRGQWSNQFGRHPNMGFWSYFEVQYGGSGGWPFILSFFALGMIGAIVAIRKRLELGLPFMTLILLTSVGLILYMNFADGTKYSFATGDAYLEVRNRDYFFTPAFVFFGIAMGIGVAAVMSWLRERVGGSTGRSVGLAAGALALLPVITLAQNYHACDRSDNILPYQYATNLLDSCEPNSILFTGGDNDTYPAWCLQEAYGYRPDITIVNLSLLNTDWYIDQMKNRYGVPISLTEDQILWHPYEVPGIGETDRPLRPFADRPRQRMTYLHPQFSGIATQHMMVDEIVIENKWEKTLYFSSPPYAESPLRLRDHAVAEGQLYRLDREPDPSLIDIDGSYNHFMETYQWEGLGNADIARDENATNVYIGLAMSSLRLYDALLRQDDRVRAEALMKRLIEVFPEFWQSYVSLADLYLSENDTTGALALYEQLDSTLTDYVAKDPLNQNYLQDLGTAKVDRGLLLNDEALVQEGLDLVRKGFDINKNAPLAYLKALTAYQLSGRQAELVQVTSEHAAYLRNRNDARVQAVLGISAPQNVPLR